MSKSNVTETALLNLIFKAIDWANVADDTLTSPATTLTVALHTSSPGEAGTQLTNETAYTSYVRVAVARPAGWTVAGDSVSPAANIDFAECGVTPGAAITHFSVGTGTSDFMLYWGTVTPNITMATGVIPRLKTTSTITED